MVSPKYVGITSYTSHLLTKMEGFPVKDYVFKKSDKTIQIPCLSEIIIGNETTNIDPMLLPEIRIHFNAIS